MLLGLCCGSAGRVELLCGTGEVVLIDGIPRTNGCCSRRAYLCTIDFVQLSIFEPCPSPRTVGPIHPEEKLDFWPVLPHACMLL